jgi:hypothetical protein
MHKTTIFKIITLHLGWVAKGKITLAMHTSFNLIHLIQLSSLHETRYNTHESGSHPDKSITPISMSKSN